MYGRRQRNPPLCRDFQRGSCRFGSQCKFSHQNQGQGNQQYEQQQQQQPQYQQQQFPSPQSGVKARLGPLNPTFTRNQGDGNQASGYQVAGADSRDLGWGSGEGGAGRAAEGGGGTTGGYFHRRGQQRQQPGQGQPQGRTVTPELHKCDYTNPRACEAEMAADREQERPQWTPTVYSHARGGANDIGVDVSPEELRCVAYIEGQAGQALPNLANREGTLFRLCADAYDLFTSSPYPGPRSPQAATAAQAFISAAASGTPVLQDRSVIPIATTHTTSPFTPAAAAFTSSPQGTPLWPQGASAPTHLPTFGSAQGSQITPSFAVNGLSSSPALPSFGSSPPAFGSSSLGAPAFGSTSISPFNAPSTSPFSTSFVPDSAFPSPFGQPSPFPGNGATRSGAFPVSSSTPASTTFQPQQSGQSSTHGDHGVDPRNAWNAPEWKLGEVPEEEPPVEVR